MGTPRAPHRPLWTVTDKHSFWLLPEWPDCTFQSPGLLVSSALTPSAGDVLGGRGTRRGHAHPPQGDQQGWPEGEPPSDFWALALFDGNGKKRLLFLTVRLGDSYHGYKSIFGACQSPVEYKELALTEPQAGGRQGHAQGWRRTQVQVWTQERTQAGAWLPPCQEEVT